MWESPAAVEAHLYVTPVRLFTLWKRSVQVFEAHLYGTPVRLFTLWKRSVQVFVGEPGHRERTPVRDTCTLIYIVEEERTGVRFANPPLGIIILKVPTARMSDT